MPITTCSRVAANARRAPTAAGRPEIPEALLRPVILGGRLVEPLPTAAEARQHAAASLGAPARRLPQPV